MRRLSRRPEDVFSFSPEHLNWRTLELVIGFVRHAESKAVATLAASSAVSGAGYAFIAQAKPIPLSLTFTLLSILSALSAGCMAGIALRPRLSSTGIRSDSIIYFAHIARYPDERSYAAAFRAKSRDSDLDSDITSQVYANAQVATLKFAWTNRAIYAFLTSLPLLVFALFINSLKTILG